MKEEFVIGKVILVIIASLFFGGCYSQKPEITTQSGSIPDSLNQASAVPEAPAQAQAAVTVPGMPPQGGFEGMPPEGGPGGMPPEGSPGGAGGAAPPQTRTYEIELFFAGIDANLDGLMSKAEFDAVGLTDRFFIFCDPDGDEHISKDEMAACALPEAVDMNGDGMLTVKEVVEFEATPLGKERGPGEPRPE